MINQIKSKVKVFDQVISKPKDRTVAKMYQIHKYWARKPWYVVSEYIKFFTAPGDTVIDVFAGSGVTGIESIANDRKAYLIDLNPIASFVTEMTAVSPVNLEALRSAFEKIQSKVKSRILELYKGGQCKNCKERLYARHFLRGPKFKKIWIKEDCYHCGLTFKARPLSKKELDVLDKIERKKISCWYPKVKFPKKFEKDRITYKGIKYVHQLFTKRNLLALSLTFHEINEIENPVINKLLRLAFSNTLLHVSKLKAENVRPLAVNNYWVPDDWIEENVWFRFEDRFYRLLDSKRISNQRITQRQVENLHIYTQSSTDLSNIETASVDYCFTDPPYGDSIQYSELSMVWNAWLREVFDKENEVIINRTQSKIASDYQKLLTKVFSETYRVLKPGSYMTVCFHNKDFKTWSTILQACRDAGFFYINMVPQAPISKSFTQLWAENSPKTDLLMNFIKPQEDFEDPEIIYTKLDSLNNLVEEAVSDLKTEKRKICLGEVYDHVLSKIVGYMFYTRDLNFDYEAYSLSKIKNVLQNHATE
jgi:DNA modification methylase